MANETGSDARYHVSLRDPMRIKMGGKMQEIVAFDGEAYEDAFFGLPDFLVFRTDAVYRDEMSGDIATCRMAIRTKLIVTIRNIAGVVPQPFEKKS